MIQSQREKHYFCLAIRAIFNLKLDFQIFFCKLGQQIYDILIQYNTIHLKKESGLLYQSNE